jgi:4-diphosphocytidyl-2-C-methyl-D-erythritol kinase
VTEIRRLRAQAPAKINRELRVGPRRPDGFHDIRSRFVTIDLADSLEAEEADGLSLACEPADLPGDGTNLVARAACALAQELGIEPRVRLLLSKRVPVGAGLGGGSADAAVTLRVLCRLWERSPSEENLSALAASLGSDVPFFLVGGEADVSGRGERVKPLEDGPSEELTLIVPPFSISTAQVYAAFDAIGGSSPPPERLEIESSGRFFGPNELEAAIVAVRPEMSEYLDRGRRIAREAAITGSGSTLVLAGARASEIAPFLAAHPGARAVVCRTIGRAEYDSLTGRSGQTPAA